MTRIIAGHAQSLRLKVPKSGTRPTSDRVREAIFSALDARDALSGMRVLDLYAGSGALGLEAASRLATSVVLVERDAAATNILRENVRAMRAMLPSGNTPDISVVQSTVAAYLRSVANTTIEQEARFDLVFLDPPYELDELELQNTLESVSALLSEHGLVVVERSSRSPEPAWPDSLTLFREKRYGETAVWFASAEPAAETQPSN